MTEILVKFSVFAAGTAQVMCIFRPLSFCCQPYFLNTSLSILHSFRKGATFL